MNQHNAISRLITRPFAALSATLSAARTARSLRCRETLRLTAQHTIHLVEWENRKLLIACHPSGATVLPEATSLATDRSPAA